MRKTAIEQTIGIMQGEGFVCNETVINDAKRYANANDDKTAQEILEQVLAKYPK